MMGNILDRLMRALGWIPASEAGDLIEVDAELRSLVSEEDLAQARRLSLAAAKAGILTPDELEVLIGRGMSSELARVRELEWAKGKTVDEIDDRIAAVWDTV